MDVYVVELAADRFARLEVEQRGADVAAALIAPSGETVVTVDGPTGGRGIEAVSILTAAVETPHAGPAGRYRLEIESPYDDVPAGDYTLRYRELRPAVDADRDRIVAERSYAAAIFRWGAGDTEAAIAGIESALPLWERAGEVRRLAEAWSSLGALRRGRGEVAHEAECWEQALVHWTELGDAERQAEVLNSLGTAYGRAGRTAEALERSRRAAELFAALGHRRGEAAALNNLGSVLRQSGELDTAQERFVRSLELRRQTGDRQGEARTLNNLGLTRFQRGELDAAISDYRAALALARRIGDRQAEAASLNNLSAAYDRLGELERSLESYREVLRFNREIGDLRAQAIALSNLGTLYGRLGERETGIDYYQQAVELAREAGDRFVEAAALDNIGWMLLALERPGEAVPYAEDALALAGEIGHASREVYAHIHLAVAHSETGDTAAAREQAGHAMQRAREIGDPFLEGTAARTLGEVLIRGGDAAAAFEPLNRALEIDRRLGVRAGEAHSLHELALATREQGDLATAASLAEQAVGLVESLRTEVAVQDLRATFLASKLDFYELWIDLLMALHREHPGGGWERRALAAAEQARARSLLDSLSQVRGEILRGVDPKLLAEERRLRRLLNALERSRQELAGAPAGDRTDPGTAQSRLQRRIQELTGEYRTLEARIRLASPRYAQLTQPRPLSVSDVQQRVLDPESLLLQYSLGRERSWLWTLSASSVEVHELPPRAEIERQARRVYELLTARNRTVDGEGASERAERIADADAAFPAAAATLSQTILGPAAERLGDRRLVMVADGALQYIPFAALPRPGSDRPLLADHEVVSLPSASAFAALRRELAGRPAPPEQLAVLADPVFDARDPRVAAARRAEQDAPAGNGDGGGGGGRDALLRGGSYRRLRFSRAEAEAIAALVPADERLKALDFAASLETATGGTLGSYRLVHLATHGVLNSDYPALSGLVLSLVDENGAPREGFLRLHDIYNLELNADLVTLSACETALGREIRGEGLVGLARGFMYAGSARVVASLWSVQDRATAKVMAAFYSAMLDGEQRPAAALRAAQLELRASERWRAPYYWSGFVLHGEWR